MDKLPLIYNPAAGTKGLKRAEKAANTLRQLGRDPLPIATTGPGSAKLLAASIALEGHPQLVVAGGDGTVNEAANGLAGSSTSLAIIPTGTANVMAHELGIPHNITRACRIALKGETIRIDLGKAGDRYFTLMAGAGFDALVIKNLNPVLKKAIRQAAFPVAGLKAFMSKEIYPLRVSAGNREVEGFFVIAANSRYYGGRFGPTPQASVTDGLLDICVLKEKSLQKMIDFWYKALTTETADPSLVEYMRVTAADVTTTGGDPVHVQVDGELAGELPMRFEVAPLALAVRVGAGR